VVALDYLWRLKVMANPNLFSATSIRGRTDALALATTSVTIATNSAASGKVFKINTLTVCCVSESDTAVTVWLSRGTNSFHLAKSLTIPAGGTLALVGRENPLYVVEGDSLAASARAAGSADAICSYEEIS
jgi:hypothetical protein